MAAPSFAHIRTSETQISSMNGNLLGMFLTKDNVFYVTGNTTTPVFRINSVEPFTAPNKAGVAVSASFSDPMSMTYGSQYDPKTHTFITCKQGKVTEFTTNETVLRTVDWAATLGTNNYQGVILGYENEDHFYVLNKATNQLFKCNRDFSGVPVFVRTIAANTNYKASYAPNGFFNHVYLYLLTYNGGYKILRTDITTGVVKEITLPVTPSGSTLTFLTLGVYNDRIVFTLAPYNDATYPALNVFDIDDAESMYFLVKDGEEMKSYSDTGYTRNLCVGGAIISSIGYETGHPNNHAFDGDPTTYWGSNEKGIDVRSGAFIGYDFQTVKRHIRRIEITKTADTESTPDYIKVQYSDDGATWVDATSPITLTKTSGVQVIELPVSSDARRWRLLAAEILNTGKTWRVAEIRMYERNLVGWYVVGTHPVAPEVYEANGLSNVDFMTFDIMKFLKYPDFEVYAYMKNQRKSVPTLDMTAIPHPRVIYPKGDIQLASVDKIEKFTITGTQIGDGVVRLILSVDGGLTWKTWNNITDTWIDINDKNLYEVKTGGMTIEAFNGITPTQWATFQTDKIRFAYYLEQLEESDEASTELLTITADMAGMWEKAKEKDYSYGYPRNDKLTVKLFQDGDYKINYTTY